jgi:hypothetical protein
VEICNSDPKCGSHSVAIVYSSPNKLANFKN